MQSSGDTAGDQIKDNCAGFIQSEQYVVHQEPFPDFHIGRSQSDSQLEQRTRALVGAISQPVVPFQQNNSVDAEVTRADMYEVDCSLHPGVRTYPQDDCLNQGDQMPGALDSSRARYNFQAGLLLTAEVVSDMKSQPASFEIPVAVPP